MGVHHDSVWFDNSNVKILGRIIYLFKKKNGEVVDGVESSGNCIIIKREKNNI